ncbi:DUF1543 domain-containing protein [Moraxella osloensis]|nr:DUF1543 domain-containing protein [Moraxella osloensis]MDI4479843.1 DUF1543 domain-containing protein [Moraxella osloensis]
MKLFMLKIGARPQGRLIEQHDVMFVIANSLSETIESVNQHWPAVKNNWHLDAWREVRRVDDYQILLSKNSLSKDGLSKDNALADNIFADETVDNKLDSQGKQLYFVNLGGYLPGQFEEFHYKTLVVAETLGKATAQVKKTAFYQDYTFDNVDTAKSGVATSHVDDKHQLDLDDIHCVADLLPRDVALTIQPLTEDEKNQLSDDALHIGYLSLKQIRTMID